MVIDTQRATHHIWKISLMKYIFSFNIHVSLYKMTKLYDNDITQFISTGYDGIFLK